MSEHTIPITLWLAGRDYRIRINAKDEEAIRMAARVAVERLQELRQGYQGKDDQDFLAMCLLMYATDQVSGDEGLNPVALNSIQSMEKMIDTALSSGEEEGKNE